MPPRPPATPYEIREDAILFYRATGPTGVYSNLFKIGVWFEGRRFRCSEDAYQFGKPVDRAVAEWLVSAPKPHLVAAAAHALFSFDIVEGWNDLKVPRMQRVVDAKFFQNEGLARGLLETGEQQLVENSKIDPFWGIGKNGTGKNMLGEILMETRCRLQGHMKQDDGGRRFAVFFDGSIVCELIEPEQGVIDRPRTARDFMKAHANRDISTRYFDAHVVPWLELTDDQKRGAIAVTSLFKHSCPSGRCVIAGMKEIGCSACDVKPEIAHQQPPSEVVRGLC